MKTYAIIPARGGSKGVPGKNVRPIAGKPLIAWSIEQALNSKGIDKVFVSTDSPEIAEVAKSYGALVPFLRPAEISGDTASTESAVLHWLDWLSDMEDKPDLIVLIQATSPIRRRGAFDDAIEQFVQHEFDSALGVCPSHRFYWRQQHTALASYDYLNRPRRQDIPKNEQQMMETGSFYLTKCGIWETVKNRLGGKVGLVIQSEEEGYEIDSISDFVLCEALLTHLLESDQDYVR